MTTVSNAPRGSTRVIVESLDNEFALLHNNSLQLLRTTPSALLYVTLAQHHTATDGLSVGESLVRGARILEQTFGGLTANLWDHPLEWTLPENLSSISLLAEYLNEVEETRKRSFSTFLTDDDLLKSISLPTGTFQSLINLLLTALIQAAHYQGQGLAILRSLSQRSGG
jgi:hypothetical protein